MATEVIQNVRFINYKQESIFYLYDINLRMIIKGTLMQI